MFWKNLKAVIWMWRWLNFVWMASGSCSVCVTSSSYLPCLSVDLQLTPPLSPCLEQQTALVMDRIRVLNALTQLNVPHSPSASSQDSDSVVNRGECTCGPRPFLKCSLLPSAGRHWRRLLPSGALEFPPPCAAGGVHSYPLFSGKQTSHSWRVEAWRSFFFFPHTCAVAFSFSLLLHCWTHFKSWVQNFTTSPPLFVCMYKY